MKDVEVYSNGLCFCSVCTNLQDALEIERRINEENTSGVAPWRISKEPRFVGGQPNPYPCNHDPSRRHFLMEC